MRDLPDLRDAIYNAPLDMRPWKEALALFRQALDARFVYMSFRPVHEGAVGIGISAADTDVSTMRRDYAERFQHINPMAFDRMELGKVYSIRDFAAEDHPFWTDYLNPSGIGNAYGFSISNGDFHAVIHLVRAAEKGDLTGDQVRWWESHAPAFSSAVRVFGEMRLRHFVTGLQSQVLDRMSLGMMILDANAHLLFANMAAHEILASQRHFGLSDDLRLRFARPDHQKVLLQSCAASGDGGNRLLCCSDGDYADRVIEILLSSVEPDHDFGLASAPALVVYLHNRAASAAPAPELLATLFGLTQAEAKVLATLAAGSTIAEAAILLGLSENTVRTQTKRILSKVGVSRQTDLIRLAIGSLANLVGK
ncbi:helix-turn-helix transcriptional regulator [Sphingobium sp. HBC34]|uniref:Helix-turn-helix transcriptional regulator n=1 Tax=Sphingobium cyanobacteriorum TaxID=3063954 RepID=A0ABT8ZN50_9SPHN|nr:helix-turn-helix transcriptional regulator [Sphingobium sp. HBC34]MDO7835612.1 helix-turn-helix transcriptional regulator [Sphingobium sp. HBC34]